MDNNYTSLKNKILHSEDLAATAEASANADVFEQVYSNLGDHNGFYVGPYHICDLPYIFLDNGQFYFYANHAELQSSGVFAESHHTIHRVSDHGAPTLDLSITNLVAFQ